MKPSTQERIERIVSRAQPYLTPGQTCALREIVEHELRCVDRDTRHACADAVNAIASEPTISGADSVKFVVTAFCNRAHQACMNTQSI